MALLRIFGYAVAKTFSKLFGLATITFFGRLPSKDDDKVGAIGLISITWFVVLAAIPFPEVGHFAFPFIEDESLLRGLAIFFAVVLPPVNGFLVTRIGNRSEERGLAQVARELLFGYGYTTIIGGLVILLVVVVPVVKASYILRLFDLKHVAVMINGDYEEAVDQIREGLRRNGLETEVRSPHWTIYRIFTALAWIEGHIFRREVADEMLILRGRTPQDEKFEVTLHATDISVLGNQHATTMVMAIIAEELDEEHLYFSWDDESQAIEDRIRELRLGLRDGSGPVPDEEEIRELCVGLRDLSLETEEWNSIRRQLYMLENECLRARLAAMEAGQEA
jgi:hypothetical protein